MYYYVGMYVVRRMNMRIYGRLLFHQGYLVYYNSNGDTALHVQSHESRISGHLYVITYSIVMPPKMHFG